MRGVMLEVPPSLLAERSRLGHDRFDEMWEGELHMVPPAGRAHMEMEFELAMRLSPFCAAEGLRVVTEIGVFDPAVPEPTSFRQPDITVYAEAAGSERGIEGAAALVVEIRSPDDESFEKLPFYDRVGVGEVLIIDPTTGALRHWVRQEGELVEVAAEAGAVLVCLPVAVSLDAGRIEVAAC